MPCQQVCPVIGGQLQIRRGRNATTFAISLHRVYFLQDSSKAFGLLICSTEVKSFASFTHHINDHSHDNDAELTISLHWHLMAEWNTLTVPQYELWLSDRILCSSNVIARLMTHWLGWNFFSFCAVIALPIGTHFIFDQLSWVLRRNEKLWKLAKLGSLSYHIFAWLIVTQGNGPERNKETKVLLNIY